MRIHARPSPNHGARPEGRAVDMLVLHYTGMESAEAALARLCDPEAGVSAHYLIEEDGHIWQLAPEHRRAWHAGLAFWAGETDINSASIGIELVNPGHEFGYRPFPALQMAALTALSRDILARHPIPQHRVLGHSDVAPQRKSDPGELFDWGFLAQEGIGYMPDFAQATAKADPLAAQEALARIGYETASIPQTLRAFQRHYRPSLCDGILDAETAARIGILAASV